MPAVNLHREQGNYIVQKSICEEKIDHLEIMVNSVITRMVARTTKSRVTLPQETNSLCYKHRKSTVSYATNNLYLSKHNQVVPIRLGRVCR